MTSVGEILRSAREDQGRSMAEIAEELCLTQRYLRALERDDLKSLPGTFFYKSFVKQYAAILGVSEEQLQPGIAALTASREDPLPGQTAGGGDAQRRPPPPIREPDPIVQESNRYFSDRRIGLSLAGLAAVLLGCSGFYAWWNKPPQIRPAEPVRPTVAVSQPEGRPVPPASLEVTTSSDDLNHVVLNLSATESTWLRITSDGKVIFSGILQPSQTKTLSGLDVAQMKVGNAGGLEVRWNGKEIGPIGARGQVRTILFTPENFQIVEPEAPPEPKAEL